MTTNADGNFAIDMVASLREFCYTAVFTGGTTTVASVTAADISNYTELSSTFTSYRPYCLEAEVEYIGESQLCKGIFGVANSNILHNSGALSDLYDEQTYKETRAEEKVAARIYFCDNSDFIVPSAVSYGGTDPIEIMHFIGIGLPVNSACVRVRWTLLFEGSVGHKHLLSRATTHTPAHPAQVAAVASIVGPNTRTAAGPSPIATLTQHAERAAVIGAEINGLFQSTRPLLTLMGDFASMAL